MEVSIKEHRQSVISLHQAGNSPAEILRSLRGLGISRKFIYRTIQRYNASESIEDRPRSGRPRSVRTPNAIKAVKARIRRNPVRHQTVMAREMAISRRSMSRILRDDLGLKAYRRRTGQFLSTQLKERRLERSKELLARYADDRHKEILFSDEKIFTVEQTFNRQNDRVYAHSSKEASAVAPRIERAHHPASLMVWWGISYHGVTKLHFCEAGVKTKAANYQSDILDGVVKPLNDTLFRGGYWVFQQDSAPAHKARTTQEWLRENVPAFISSQEWPPGSPDLNPLDYAIWADLEAKVCTSKHTNLSSLKRALVRETENYPIEKVRAAIDEWPRRLKSCVKARGGHFE